MPENDLRRDIRTRSVKLISYPIDFLMRWRSIVKFLRLEELIVCAVTGERRAVVEKLDALVKGYKPMYEFHGGPGAPVGAAAPKTAEQGRSWKPQNSRRQGQLQLLLVAIYCVME